MNKFVVLDKQIGETPLSCSETYREQNPDLQGVSMAYAGRLDPMASGKLLVLLGEECKNQTEYHGLDKEYEFSILLGVESDSQDVLGRLQTCTNAMEQASPEDKNITTIAKQFVGPIELPYPIFSAKTVRGKPLHTWTMEGRLDEIEIPTKKSVVHKLELLKTETLSRTQISDLARTKIDTIPPVTDLRKALGNDFRRVDVRKDWENMKTNNELPDTYTIAHFSCTASSGTYMRTLASEIAKKLDTCGLAWHIHRTEIGKYESVGWIIKY